MSSAVWMIIYGLNADREAEYLDWFHDVHMPEKLSRPGYTWASHYRSAEPMQDVGGPLYLALFGGDTSAVFYHPSPAQLAPTQPPETRAMMACRVKSRTLIFASEWSADAGGTPVADSPTIDAEAISLTLCDTAGNDMDFSAWLVQEHLPALAGNGIRKLVASTGDVRHGIVHTRAADAPPPGPFTGPATGDWSERVGTYLSFPFGEPLIPLNKVSP